jgi:hypothetical protein
MPHFMQQPRSLIAKLILIATLTALLVGNTPSAAEFQECQL